MRLLGKTAIITGASSGMGAAQARLFVREGARVVLADIDQAGARIADELGPAARFFEHDVGSEANWKDIMTFTEAEVGLPTLLINTAGAVVLRPFSETTVAEFERLFRVNQLGTFLGIRSAIDPMTRAGGGAIVNISSVGGMTGLAGLCAYSSTKWAVRGIARAAAIELAPLNIRVNTIFPGPIDTPMARDTMAVFDEQVKPHLPIARIGTAEEIAAATLFLASDEASYVLGAELAVDGGQMA